MVRVRVTSHAPSFLHGDESHATGETFDAAESVVADFPRSLERAADAADGTDPDETDGDSEPETGGSGGEDGAAPPFSPGEFTVAELDARIADSDHTEDEREALADAERAGKNRSGAIDVLKP